MSEIAALSNGKESIPVKPNESLIDVAEQLGIPFSCTEGKCGTCLSKVIQGIENLSSLTEAEEIYGLDEGERLLCQARIQKGKVTVQS